MLNVHVHQLGGGESVVMSDAGDSITAVRERVRQILSRHVGHEGALLTALLDVQYQLGHVPESTVEDASDILGHSAPEVWGVLTFYEDFKLGKTADHFIDVCIDAPCHVDGASRILQALEVELAKQPEGVRKRFQLRRTSCPRLCMQAPVIAVDQHWNGRMTPERAVKLTAGLG